jgi:hypothetical protein
MRSTLLTLGAVLTAVALTGACKKKPPPVDDDQVPPVPSPAISTAPSAAATPPPVIILLDAAPPSSPQTAAAIALVSKWSMAHQKGDAQELQGLFAPKVTVNGATMNAADHAKKTIHQDPDLRFSIGEVNAETTADGKDTFAHFTKKLAEVKGEKTTEYPKLVIVRDGVIVEESDDPPDWCINKDKTTNAKMQPGFKLSATSAVAAAKESKHFAELRKRVPHLGSDLFGFGCAKRCAVPRRDCGYHFRLSDMEDSTKIIEWVYVDPVTKTLWWQEKDWMSEQLR